MTRTYAIEPWAKWGPFPEHYTLKLIEDEVCRETQPHSHKIEAQAAGFRWMTEERV